MLVWILLKNAIEWLMGAVTYSFTVWLMPLIIIGVILSVIGIKVGHLGSAVLKVVGNGIVSGLTWLVKLIPNLFKAIKKFYLFMSSVVFKSLPTWVAKLLAILIIVII